MEGGSRTHLAYLQPLQMQLSRHVGQVLLHHWQKAESARTTIKSWLWATLKNSFGYRLNQADSGQSGSKLKNTLELNIAGR